MSTQNINLETLPPPPPDNNERKKERFLERQTSLLIDETHHRFPYAGCSEIVVGAGWGGIYSFYRRVLDGVQLHNQSGSRYCLMEQSSRIGGRTYSVPVSHRHTGGGEADFVLDVGADRFTPDMHLVGDLILKQLQLPTECYEPNCPSPTLEDDFTLPRRRKLNFTAPFRRLIDPHTGLPSGFDTALQRMVKTCQELGARVFMQTKLVRLIFEKDKGKTHLEFEDTATGTRFDIDSDDENANVIILNLPRNHLFNVDGVRASLEPNVAKTLECIVFDTPEDLFGKETVERIHENQKYVTTFGKAYLYYEDAWWRSKLNQTVGIWPPDAGSLDAVPTPEGVLLNVRWHDGPVQCQRHQGLIVSSPLSSSFTCRGFLEVYYSISNETFYSSLPAATDGVVDETTLHTEDPLGMLWVDESPHARAELNLVHKALMQSLQPLWNQTPSLFEAQKNIAPPLGMVVGIWQRPNLYNPLGTGWTNPIKVYYEPSMSGTPDKACGVPGLTEESYRRTVLQPFDPNSFACSQSPGRGVSQPRIFLVNNDYVCTNVRYSFGDWAEESLMQAEHAMYILGTARPWWVDDVYYRLHIFDSQPPHVQINTPSSSMTTTSTGMNQAWLILLVVMVAFGVVVFVLELYNRSRQVSTVAVVREFISRNSSSRDQPLNSETVLIVPAKSEGAHSRLREVDEAELKKGEQGALVACNEEKVECGVGGDSDESDDDSDQYQTELVNLWRWENLAIPVSYIVCGVTGGLFRTFMNVYPIDIGANEAQQTTFVTLSALPAAFKILYGFTSDTNPIFGYRRKPYMFLGWLLASLSMLSLLMTADLTLVRRPPTEQEKLEDAGHHYKHMTETVVVPENAPSLTRLGWCFFLFGFGMWFANAMTDAWVAEKSKHEPEAVRGSLQSTCYVVRFFGLMVSAPISTYLYSTVGPQVIVMGMVCIPLFLLPLIWWLAESQVDVKPVREQCREIWNTVCLRSVWEPMAFLYLFNLLQVSNSAWRQFLVTVCGFTPANLNTLLVVSYALVYLGTMLYKYCLLHTSWRLIYQCCIVLNLLFSSLQLLLISGYTFGLPPLLFALGDDAFGEFLSGIQFLPAVVMMVSLCPTGSEGVSYAMFTTVMNSSWMIANVTSSLLLSIWDVRKETLENGDLNGMFKLSLLTTIVQCFPLAFVHWLPHGRKELEALTSLSFSGSPIGGGIFLFVLGASMTITVLVSILNITCPGWAGES